MVPEPIDFEVKDMTCGHCAATITKAVTQADPGAKVEIDLTAHRVQVWPTTAGVAAIEAAIRDAGYDEVTRRA